MNIDPSCADLASCLEKINTAEYLPSPDKALSRCLKLLIQKDILINQLEETFKIEAGLCAQLLKVANSAFYGAPKQIYDVHHAIIIIGLRETKNICLATALMQQFPQTSLPPSFDLIRFWRHSMLTSFIASELAADKAWIKRDDAQIYGLLHDIGRLVMAALMPDQFNKVVQLSQAEDSSLYEAEDALGITHAYMGWALAKKWGLPEPMCSIIRWHHDPIRGVPWSREASIVYLADYLANIIGGSLDTPKISQPPAEIMSLADIGLYELQDYTKILKDLVKKTNVFIQEEL